ncbi:unnamed protein product [Polarella glacialis]|uniref:Uncharacterized protein n=1 Tax=Polarella glacialis TaxID=89957 RepID=A0A813HD13_POLGL|nr:unnamed protein product [Polarella glacialis]
MSRAWKSSEALLLDDGYTYECTSTGNRVTQLEVGLDGVAVVVSAGGAAHDCITDASMGGLTLAQLRWMFSDWNNSMLESPDHGGVKMSSVAPNDDDDGVKEWSDLSQRCKEVPINIYGPGDQSGTQSFFGEVVLCTDCFAKKAGLPRENFPNCDQASTQTLENLSATADIENFLITQRPRNCYMPSEDDNAILNWVMADPGGIAYLGFAYYSRNVAGLTVARIADDVVRGVQDTTEAKVFPSHYTIIDGSYAVFRRQLYMNVDNAAWSQASTFLEYGFTHEGQELVKTVGYVAINANLLAKMQQRISQRGNANADYLPVVPSSCWSGTELQTVPYTNQFGTAKVKYSCAPCAKGRYKQGNDAANSCQLCEPGFFAPVSGQSHCKFCSPGKFSSAESTYCTDCPVNTAASMPGQGLCDVCSPGLHTFQTGSTSCEHCPVGTYRSAQNVSCQQCPHTMTTAFQGATSPNYCVCAGSLYLEVVTEMGDDTPCASCPSGMSCALSSDMANYAANYALGFSPGSETSKPYPLLLPGFFSTREEPLSVFKCSVKGSCPGGVPGSCSGGLVGLACCHCPQGYFIQDGSCQTCEPGLAISHFALLLFGASVILTLMHIMGNWPIVRGSKQVTIAAFWLGMAVTVVLTCAVYATLDITGGLPLPDFFSALQFLTLDYFMISACLLGATSHVELYIFKLLFFPFACFITCLGAMVCSALPGCRRFASFHGPALQNSAGFLMSTIFVAISLVSLDGFRCMQNPNGEDTWKSHASVICWRGDDHAVIVGMSAAAILLYPVSFLAFTAWASFQYGPLTVEYGILFTRRVRFLSSWMKPDCVAYAFWWNARNFFIAIVPVVAAGNYGAQVFLFMATFLAWMVTQLSRCCWRFPGLNMLDAAVSVTHILLLCLFAMLASADEDIDRTSVGWCMVSLLITGVTSLILAAVLKIVFHLRSKIVFDLFITHHKSAAALYARQVKTVFEGMSKLSVFLDVDELDSLDYIPFAVQQTRRLIVILTKDVLRRPWCALEIATAFKNNIPISVVQINDVAIDTTTSFLQGVLDSFQPADFKILSMAGISIDDLRTSYFSLASLPKTNLPLSTPDVKLNELCAQETVGEAFFRHVKSQPVVAKEPEKLVYIVYDSRDNLQGSYAYMLHHLLRQQSWDVHFMGSIVQRQEILKPKSVCVTLMSKGLIKDPIALGVAILVQRKGIPLITVVSHEGYTSLDKHDFEKMEAGTFWSQDELHKVQEVAQASDEKELFLACTSLHEVLAWQFSPQNNRKLMKQEFKIIEKRAQEELIRQTMIEESDRSITSSRMFSSDRSSTLSRMFSRDRSNTPDPPASNRTSVELGIAIANDKRIDRE